MNLQDLILAVREENLTKSQLESYHLALCNLKAELKQEFGVLKKEEALYLLGRKDESVASRKIAWGASERGQRRYEVESDIGSVNALLEGTKARLFSIY